MKDAGKIRHKHPERKLMLPGVSVRVDTLGRTESSLQDTSSLGRNTAMNRRKPTDKEIGDGLAAYPGALRDTCDRADDVIPLLRESKNRYHNSLVEVLRSNTDQTRTTLIAIFERLIERGSMDE